MSIAYEHLLDTHNNIHIVRYQEIYTAACITLPITQSYFKAMKHTDVCTVTESQNYINTRSISYSHNNNYHHQNHWRLSRLQ